MLYEVITLQALAHIAHLHHNQGGILVLAGGVELDRVVADDHAGTAGQRNNFV